MKMRDRWNQLTKLRDHLVAKDSEKWEDDIARIDAELDRMISTPFVVERQKYEAQG